MKYLGPGFLIAIAYIDPGNLAADIAAGQYGRYSLLWSLLLAGILGFFFQIYSIKMGVVTGKSMSHLCRINMTERWKRILVWVMAEIAIIGSDLQEVLGSAIALQILFGIPMWVGVILTVSTTLLILLIQLYGMKFL